MLAAPLEAAKTSVALPSAVGVPLFEIEDGVYHLTYEPKKKLPVEEFLRLQGRFSHMFKPGSEWMIAEAQSYVDKKWEQLLSIVGDTIKKIIQKIKEGCQNIIAKITDLFTKSKKDNINPNVDIDGKNIGKLKKALDFVKKVITWPIKKWIKCFKEGSKFWTILLTTIGVTATIDIAQSKKRYDARERNVTRINNVIDNYIEKNTKLYNDLVDLAKEGKITAKKLSEYTDQYNNVYNQLIEGKQHTRDILNDKFGTAEFNPYPVKALKKVFELLSTILAKISKGMIALQR